MKTEHLATFCNARWDNSALPALIEYIRIPNKSPMFDPDWQENGYMDQVVTQFAAWCKAQHIPGMQGEVVRLPGRTPLLFLEIPGQSDRTVLFYGHLDKQPEMSGWREGLGPWQPVLDGNKLYGRGGADDGYAMFGSLIAIQALQQQGIAHGRCVVIIEACEESGSYDLPYYIEALADRIGTPQLVICLDSGCGNYDQLWATTSLRGVVGGTLQVRILNEGVHSGDATGVVPSSFRILRQLLGRLEDPDTGVIADAAFNVEIPAMRIEQAKQAAAVMDKSVFQRFPFTQTAKPVNEDPQQLILNRTWQPGLEIIGCDGIPAPAAAGNVMRPGTTVKISIRIPPTCNAEAAAERLKTLFETDPPYGAEVEFTPDWCAGGWHAPAMAPWLEQAIVNASKAQFGAPALHMGEGGTIPFMGMLGERFPAAQFLITGVLGPGSNAHGPNEFLHLPTAKKLTACIAMVIAGHYEETG